MENKSPDRGVKEITEIGKIARFYGFKPIIPPTITKQDFSQAKNFEDEGLVEKIAILRMYFEEKLMGGIQPSMFYCEKPFPGSKERKKPLRLESSLVSIGSSKSVCECLAIQASISILNTLGYKNLEVHINSVGDSDSISDFQKKLSVFVKKNYNTFPAELRQALKKDICSIIKEQNEEWSSFQNECPKTIDFLSENSRSHFKEVLEFLEIMEIPYHINNSLISDLNISSGTVFVIKSSEDSSTQTGKALASGACFNRLAKKMGYKKDLHSCVCNISARLKKSLKKTKVRPLKPQFYLVQFSPEAKLKSFLILRELYKAGANVLHSIAKDKLSNQMGIAEASGAPYIILIGQKEALENCVIIRNIANHVQETVSIPDLAVRAKEIIKGL
ncbi:MAG: hypothetical protein GX627_02335 [Parcubacteria group bacterium]|mgnify:CR=1 FL=1|jgi:histidyl-tRNA synthetase|nr:hypothetical protein [Parcubacteria group bacterium]